MTVLGCEGCEDPATREVWWTEWPRTVDERGRTTPVCDTAECLNLVEAGIVRDGGDLAGQIDPIPTCTSIPSPERIAA